MPITDERLSALEQRIADVEAVLLGLMDNIDAGFIGQALRSDVAEALGRIRERGEVGGHAR